ncbi:hypothetical protein [Pseudoalteromonas sp. GABNS16H]|uniref:hypothetical protein n=1 Tax=Pseudoalteromonas sp. GABNS16H TaxID=3025325 RepID=UPI002362F410|nr:hypothetical protein [Pseudoalteromonas sp. GABNS16H]MDC9612015.1 hypothetical protein [Pseudoalteromonas sp. GABNS16H]
MNDGAKTFLTFAIAVAAFGLGGTLVDSQGSNQVVWRTVATAPLLCLGASSLFFRWPAYIMRYFDGVAERDAQRGLLSLHNLGTAIIVVIGIFALIAY